MKYLMLSLFVLFFLSSSNTSLNGQSKDTCNYCEVYKRAFFLKSPDTINHILQNSKLDLSDKDKAELYSIRSLLSYRLNKHSDNYNQTIKDSILNDINISTSFIEGNENLLYLFRRHLTRTQQLDLNALDEDLTILKNNGYKEEKQGLGLRLSLRKDENFWGGLELAVFSIIEPAYKLKADSILVNRKKFMTAYSAFILGYSKSLTNDLQEIKLSLFKFESPIYVDILQFGIIHNFKKESIFYRPEVGFGKWGFTLSYGINLYLNSSSDFHPNRHNINLRYLHTFNKKRK